ncbi:MAG: HEAT repeat domain-containing protein [candidate division Zixibacteria bacterium]|nr:HEAT repeat domain-containing protein [candidate division Zixibacteria bacterium]
MPDISLYSEWLKTTIAAVKKLTFYPSGHPTLAAAISIPFEGMQKIFSEAESIDVSVVNDKFVINGESIPDDFSKNPLHPLFASGNVKSIQFGKSITQEEFETFLNYFVKKTQDRKFNQPVEVYIQEQSLKSVSVNKLQYVALSEKDTVVTRTEKVRLNLKGQLAQSLKENPEILRDLLFDPDKTPTKLGKEFGIVLADDKLEESVHTELSKLTDQKILELVVNRIQKELNKTLAQDCRKKDELNNLLQALSSQDLRTAFPQVDDVLSRYGLINKNVFKQMLANRLPTTGAAQPAISALMDELLKGKADPKIPTNLSQSLTKLDDQKQFSAIVQKLGAEFGNQNPEVVKNVRTVIQSVLEKSTSLERRFQSELIARLCLDKINDESLTESSFEEVCQLAKTVIESQIEQERYQECREILLALRFQCQNRVDFSENFIRRVQNLREEIGNSARARKLVADWVYKWGSKTWKDVGALLEQLPTPAVAREIVSLLPSQNPEQESKVIELLNSMPSAALNAVSSVINAGSRKLESIPKEGEGLKPDKVEAFLKILNNFKQIEAVNLLGKLRHVPESRTRLKVAQALAAHPNPDARGFLFTMLSDSDRRIKDAVIVSMAERPDHRTPKILINHFSEFPADRNLVCTALLKLTGAQVTDFFLYLLTGESRQELKIPGKIEPEFKDLAVKYLSSNMNEEVASRLEEYLATQKKQFLSIIKKDPLRDQIQKMLAEWSTGSALPTRR